MAHIAGIKTETDRQGNLKSITIDLKKHPGAVEALKGIGLIDDRSELQKEVDANPENFMTVEECFDRLVEKIDNHSSWK